MILKLTLIAFVGIIGAEDSDCKAFVGSTPTKIQKNNQLGTIPAWGPGWEIRIDVKFNSIKTDTYYNIIRLNAIDGHGGKIGQRIPGFWTVKGTHNKLTIHTDIDNNPNRYFTNELGTFECHKWYHFVISQRKIGDSFFFEVKVNGIRKVHVKNNNPQHFTNVKVFAGDYHQPADAVIRFFYACQLREARSNPTCSKNKEIKVENNNLIGIIPSWGPTFKISFELKVVSFTTCNPMEMANYLTFTATDNNCCDIGDRIPAFFTNSGGFLQLAMQINHDGNVIKSSPKLEENVWYKLEVEQLIQNNQFFFVLRSSGREIFREVQRIPKHFKNVKVYASKYAPANAVIRNLVY